MIQFVTAQHTSHLGLPPSLLLLFGSGAAAMAVLGRRRIQKDR